MSISNRKDYNKSLYLIEKSISNRNVCTSLSNRKVYTKSIYLIEKSISNRTRLYEKPISYLKVYI